MNSTPTKVNLAECIYVTLWCLAVLLLIVVTAPFWICGMIRDLWERNT